MDDKKENQDFEVSINLDTTPILYTDNVIMHINSDGVVLEICQKLGQSNQVRIVARVGMSQDHAKKFVQELSKLLSVSETKTLLPKKAARS